VTARAPDTLDTLAAGHDLAKEAVAELGRYVDLLLTWPGNVTAITERDAVVSTLLGDSLALLDAQALRERAAEPWVDLGAGAGVPGLPLAIALPRLRLTLLESASRKCAFLRQAVAAAGLQDRCTVECARSELFATPGAPGRDAYGVVLARAVAPLPVLVELAAPLLRQGGVLVASKTRRALGHEGPLAEAAAALCGMEARPPQALPQSPLDDAVAAVYEKVAATPDRLPRREGMAAKRPLGR
jgi:16S rRNA (guanine527-N7)-methyltransferase